MNKDKKNNKKHKEAKNNIPIITNVDKEIADELELIDKLSGVNNSSNKNKIVDNNGPDSPNSQDSSSSNSGSSSSSSSSSNSSSNSNSSSSSNSSSELESSSSDSNNKNKLKKNELPKNNLLLQELLNKQINMTSVINKLGYSDMRRICKNLKKSIFTDECSLWSGYITNNKNGKQYINFYFKKKKVALHRLLYMNYIGKVEKNEYLKQTCKNLGKCCSVFHLRIANSKSENSENSKNKKNENKNEGKSSDKQPDRVIVVRDKVNIEI